MHARQDSVLELAVELDLLPSLELFAFLAKYMMCIAFVLRPAGSKQGWGEISALSNSHMQSKQAWARHAHALAFLALALPVVVTWC